MKIKEILTDKEIEQCTKELPFGYMANEEAIDMKLANHVLDMDLKEYLIYRQLDLLTMIASNTLPEEYR